MWENSMTRWAFVAALALIGLHAAAATSRGLMQVQSVQQTPNGFTGELRVFMATGLVDTVKQPDPPFVNCSGFGACDGDYFHKEVMGRSEEETAELDELAAAFFLDRFGIDVASSANTGRIRFGRWISDPRVNYRNYLTTGRVVPPEGWWLYEGGWILRILDPVGFELGGEWEGRAVTPGATFMIGNYLVLETDETGDVVNRMPIYYRSAGPVEFDSTGQEAKFRWELSLDGQDFPTGVQGQASGFFGVYRAPEVGQTMTKWNIRNVLTFGESTVFAGLGPDDIAGGIPLLE